MAAHRPYRPSLGDENAAREWQPDERAEYVKAHAPTAHDGNQRLHRATESNRTLLAMTMTSRHRTWTP